MTRTEDRWLELLIERTAELNFYRDMKPAGSRWGAWKWLQEEYRERARNQVVAELHESAAGSAENAHLVSFSAASGRID